MGIWEMWWLGKRSLGEKVVLVLQALNCFCFWERKGTIGSPDKAELPYCTVHIYRHFRQRWGLEEGYAHSSNQVEFQIAKIFPMLACLKSSQRPGNSRFSERPSIMEQRMEGHLTSSSVLCAHVLPAIFPHTCIPPHSHTTYCIYVCTNI